MNKLKQKGDALIAIGVTIVVTVILSLMFGLPIWNVWKQELSGKAEFREAEWSKKVKIEEARAALDSATYYANAEIERAKGAAEANKIVGKYLGGPEAYLRWLYIEQLPDIKGQIIYLPTEAGIPILEAGKR